MERLTLDRTILFLGFGAVAQCVLPLFFEKFTPSSGVKIYIMDIQDYRHRIPESLRKQVEYIQQKITSDNIEKTLADYLKAGDMLIDLAYDIDCCTVLQWCYDHQVMYLNTSVELWNPYLTHDKSPEIRTLYPRHMAIRKMLKTWDKKGATAVLEHGANPGLVSHFTKKALIDIARKIILEQPENSKIDALKQHIATKNFPLIAQTLGVKVIHISERDTQLTQLPKQVGEFVNTWSVAGLYEEGTAPAEMGWGTHETELPPHSFTHQEGPKNQICLGKMGMETWARSYVPSGDIVGMIVRHGEAFTISDHLTVWENGHAVYRPTVHYVYCPSDSAISSLHELKMNHLEFPKKMRILNDEITQGKDEVGVLLMGHDFKSWWTGSVLDIEQARQLVPHQNATTLQVASSIVAAMCWMHKNPEQGVCVPDDLPYQEILEVATPYLGEIISQPFDWTPLKNRVNFFADFSGEQLNEQDPWQFKNFHLPIF